MDYTDLRKLALHFNKKIFGNTYVMIAGKNGKSNKFEIKFNESEFTHFTGLEHFTVIADEIKHKPKINRITGKKINISKLRTDLYKDILKWKFRGDVTETINFPCTFNPITKKECTIEERINELIHLKYNLGITQKSSYLYKWNKKIVTLSLVMVILEIVLFQQIMF